MAFLIAPGHDLLASACLCSQLSARKASSTSSGPTVPNSIAIAVTVACGKSLDAAPIQSPPMVAEADSREPTGVTHVPYQDFARVYSSLSVDEVVISSPNPKGPRPE